MGKLYPETRHSSVVRTYFGTEVPDPFSWLEDDHSEETQHWVDEQNAFTREFMSQIPFRNAIKERLTSLYEYAREGAPFKKGGWYFQYKNTGLQNQDVLYVKTYFNGEGRVLLDPNLLSENGTIALSSISVSDDGKTMAYAISRGGSDWNEIYFRDIETGKDLPDVLHWVKHSEISWYQKGVFYSRYPEPQEGDALKGKNIHNKVYYHQLGENQSQDELILETPDKPEWSFSPKVLDEKWLALVVFESTSGNALFFKNLQGDDAKWIRLGMDFTDEYELLGLSDDQVYLKTDRDAPMGKVVSLDLTQPDDLTLNTVVPEKEDTLVAHHLVGRTIILEYLKNAYTQVERFTLDETFLGTIDLPGIGTVSGFSGDKRATETFYTFSSFTNPASVYRYDIEKNKSDLIARPKINFDFEKYETRQVKYPSKDGTLISMFLVHKKGLSLDGNRPTLLYGYGGFNISLTPEFNIVRLPWLENDGVIAIANLRGGGEYGAEWHKAGTLMQKQNVFDDFIAAAEYLINEKYTQPAKLTIQGGSNGGLLIGAVANQRPELFRVALPAVGVMDMLRYHKFTIGRYWATDYGTSEQSKDMFEYLWAYSPVHNVKPETEYPAIMVTTADHDDRVVPAHSFKYAAELQDKAYGNRPRLIRIDKEAGHGAGKPVDKIIDYYADLWSFAFLNLQVEPI